MTQYQQTIQDADEPTHMADEKQDGSSFTTGQAVTRAGNSTAIRGVCGLLYDSVAIPAGSTIDSAFLQVGSAGSVGDILVDIHANDVDDAANFSVEADATSRARTTASVTFNYTNIPQTMDDSPDIKTVIQEVVDRAGWSSENSICLLLVGRNNGTSLFAQIDNDLGGNTNPRLTINFTEPTAAGGGGSGGPQLQGVFDMQGMI